MERDAEGRRFWVVPYGRDEVRLELDSAWYDDGADDGDALAGWTLLERLIDAGLGGVGHDSGLHGVLLEVHGALVAQRLGTWSQGEKSAEIKFGYFYPLRFSKEQLYQAVSYGAK